MEGPEGQEQTIDLERNLESRRLNIDLALRRCQRKGWQPREYFLRVTEPSRQVPEIAPTVDELRRELASLPDVDWQSADREALGDRLYEMAKPLLIKEYENGRAIIDPADHEHWQEAGVLQYEIYDPTSDPANREFGTMPMMIVHLPSQAGQLGREDMVSSLKKLATELRAQPEIKGVLGSSLLLEHPLFQRLGFHIDEARDDGDRPISMIPRQEFLERYGS